MPKGLTSAIRTLTIFPCPGEDASHMSSALPWFPFVGALLGTMLYFLSMILIFITRGLWPEFVSLIVVSAGIILTRGLHLDGFADFSDAFWGAFEKEKTLKIMKDTYLGSFGSLALVLLILAKWVAITKLIHIRSTLWLICAFTVSRAVLVDLAVRLPYARKEGGTGASFIESAQPEHRLVSWIGTIVIVLMLYGWIGFLPIFTAWIAGYFFGNWSKKRIDGITGDILGATIELTETLLLIMPFFFL